MAACEGQHVVTIEGLSTGDELHPMQAAFLHCDGFQCGYSIMTTDSNITAPTQFLSGKTETYAYRRIGGGVRRPLLCLQHFTGTLDNWDPAVTDPLASDRSFCSTARA